MRVRIFFCHLIVSLWFGAMLSFAVVVAPTLFRTLSPEQAASVVRGSLEKLEVGGLIGGIVLLVCHAYSIHRRRGDASNTESRRNARTQGALIVAMLALVAASHLLVSPRMRNLRQAAGGSISALAPLDPSRREYERLHRISELLMLGQILGAGALLFSFSPARTALRER